MIWNLLNNTDHKMDKKSDGKALQIYQRLTQHFFKKTESQYVVFAKATV